MTFAVPLLPYRRGNACKSHDLAQFDHRYYIRGTLKWLPGVSAWLKAWWICVGVKQATDQKSMPPLPWWRGNARDFGSIWPQILYPWKFEEADRCFALAQGLVDLFWPQILYLWDFEEADGCFSLAQGLVDPFWPQILYPWDFEEADGYFGLAQGLVDPFQGLVDLQEMPAKIMIFAQFGHGYYTRETLKRLMGVLAWLIAGWIRMLWPASGLGGSVEEMHTKVMILAQFGHGYYIRGTLK
ncbi:hypothetical protein C8R44DRAFT_731576 [Mycena epipterygia]|nr:hypothetical protein C8R44DRAFT_731576 [Mycena epipterygia]